MQCQGVKVEVNTTTAITKEDALGNVILSLLFSFISCMLRKTLSESYLLPLSTDSGG